MKHSISFILISNRDLVVPVTDSIICLPKYFTSLCAFPTTFFPSAFTSFLSGVPKVKHLALSPSSSWQFLCERDSVEIKRKQLENCHKICVYTYTCTHIHIFILKIICNELLTSPISLWQSYNPGRGWQHSKILLFSKTV